MESRRVERVLSPSPRRRRTDIAAGGGRHARPALVEAATRSRFGWPGRGNARLAWRVDGAATGVCGARGGAIHHRLWKCERHVRRIAYRHSRSRLWRRLGARHRDRYRASRRAGHDRWPATPAQGHRWETSPALVDAPPRRGNPRVDGVASVAPTRAFSGGRDVRYGTSKGWCARSRYEPLEPWLAWRPAC